MKIEAANDFRTSETEGIDIVIKDGTRVFKATVGRWENFQKIADDMANWHHGFVVLEPQTVTVEVREADFENRTFGKLLAERTVVLEPEHIGFDDMDDDLFWEDEED